MGRFLWSVGGWMLAFLVGGGLWLDLQGAKRDLREAQQSQAKWQARYAEASTSVKTQTVTVTKWATRYDTLRARITDTVTVPDWGTVLEAADSTIAACRDLVSSCEQFRIVADSTIAATRREATAYKNLYHATRPTWRDRFGISCGYSVSKIGADFKAGPSCQVGVRVFP